MSRSDAYVVSGVCCSTEERVLRKVLDGALGTEGYRFDPLTCELSVSVPVGEETVLHQLRQAGFDGRRKESLPQQESFLRRHAEGLTTVAAGTLTGGGLIAGGVAAHICFGLAICIGGWRVLRRAVGALRSRTLDMNVLMITAVAGALAIGHWEEASAVIVLYALSLMLESYSSARTRRAIRSLMSLTPETAALVRDGQETVVPVTAVRPDDLILVRPGERLPLDGTVTEGSSLVNEAPVTGESSPVVKVPGSVIYAGTLNGNGSLRIRVARRADESAISHITRLIEEAQRQRAPVQQFIDRFARVYTPAVFAFALVVAVLPPLVLGGQLEPWLYRALVLLVIACPCALVISTPVTLVSAMTRAARIGVLIKGGRHVESLARVSAVALDKTGTLTVGMPAVTDIVPLNSMPHDELLALVAALEQNSEHHLAAAALRAAHHASLSVVPVNVEEFEALPGKGVRGRINETLYFLGNRALAAEVGYLTSAAEHACDRLEAEGKTPVILGTMHLPLCVIGFRDDLRHQGRRTITSLRAMGIRRIIMLSGDNEAAATGIAQELGLDEVRAELLPEGKVHAVEELRQSERAVAMVGDGINDAPALAAASVGIAMGVAGSDAALETADIVLMSDNLRHLPYVFGLSRATLSIIRQNVALAISVKLVFLTLALAGAATLWMAVLADDGAALLVILNALRILRYTEYL